MLEEKAERILPVHLFARRMAYSALLWLSLMAVALSIGVAGYCWITGFTLVDAILNASMNLTGMGPVSEMTFQAHTVTTLKSKIPGIRTELKVYSFMARRLTAAATSAREISAPAAVAAQLMLCDEPPCAR